jgi:mono/diheme cytochrome c family protein
MVNQDLSGKIIPAAAGAATGVLIFTGLSLWFGNPLFPSVEALPTYPTPYTPSPTAAALAASKPAAAVDAGAQSYAAACGACHQADGKGLAGAFPPLAGSEWVTQDPETPIRIVLAGLSGPITVAGGQFNSMMPAPAGLDDAKVAEILTYVRANFGNQAAAIDAAAVAAVRGALAGRTTPWTAPELTALRAPAAAPAAAPQP